MRSLAVATVPMIPVVDPKAQPSQKPSQSELDSFAAAVSRKAPLICQGVVDQLAKANVNASVSQVNGLFIISVANPTPNTDASTPETAIALTQGTNIAISGAEIPTIISAVSTAITNVFSNTNIVAGLIVTGVTFAAAYRLFIRKG